MKIAIKSLYKKQWQKNINLEVYRIGKRKSEAIGLRYNDIKNESIVMFEIVLSLARLIVCVKIYC